MRLAGSAAEAMHICSEHAGAIDVVVSDLGLNDGAGHRATFLRKPFELERLARAVRALVPPS